MNPGILPAGISTHNCLKTAAVRTGQTSLHHHNVLQSDYSSASITQRVGSGTADGFNGIRISQSDQHNDQLNDRRVWSRADQQRPARTHSNFSHFVTFWVF